MATDREEQLKKVFSQTMLDSAKHFYNQISVVKDALTAYRTGGVHAMHDPTEGGILNGIHEMADAANLGVRIYEEKITIEPETAKICRYYEIDPLQLISSGALLIAADPQAAPKIIENLAKEHIYADIIGEFTPNPNKRTLSTRRRLSGDAAETSLRPPLDSTIKALTVIS